MQYRWCIFTADLNPVIGSEQGRVRPVLVISDENINQILPVVNVLPITSKKEKRKIYPNEIFITSASSGLPKNSIILCHQIRTLDKIRLTKKIGEIVDNELQHQIIEGLCFQLAID